ncbi:MAG: hypothetical protein JNK05_36170 [Myxococcales bacterium]|nr:hypothetical protein [Myxococcales bacterium]
MTTIRCTRCGSSCDDSTASFAESGLICDPCARGETARDAAQMMQSAQAAERAAGFTPAGAPQYSTAPASVGPRHHTSAHEALRARGATVQQSNLSTTVSVGPVSSTRDGLKEIWTLPSAPSVQATFASEGFFTMVKKLFSREIQTGDEAFDRAVFIQTTTPEATQAWLASPEVRSALATIVNSGESFSIEGSTVTGSVYWDVGAVGSPEVIAQLAASLR